MQTQLTRLLFVSSLGLAACSDEALSNLEGLPDLNSSSQIQAWLKSNGYKDWTCEAMPTAKTGGTPGIHVHGTNRVCVNSLLKQSVSGPLPRGAAAVKEIHSGGGITKYYLEVKIADDSAGGDGWFWYNGIASASAGSGERGDASCTGCHAGAASDADHPGRGDYVYFVP